MILTICINHSVLSTDRKLSTRANRQRARLEIDMDKAASENSPPSSSPEKDPLTTARAARLRAIRELVETDDYRVPALLVAERMIERALTGHEFLEE